MAEIGGFDFARQIRSAGRLLQHNATARQGIDTIGAGQRFFNELLDQQHGGALTPQFSHHAEDAIDEDGRDGP